jgi:hypothetical protein
MNAQLAERTRAMIPRYEQLFKERGGITPSDPLFFHLYHLSRYWIRLVGFCKRVPDKPETAIDSDYGACLAVASEFANKVIGVSSPVHELWQDCWRRTQAVLHERPVTLNDVEAASRSFDACLCRLNYDPWS